VEQRLAIAPLVMQVLSGASRLKILATSREAVRVPDERVVPIAPPVQPGPRAATAEGTLGVLRPVLCVDEQVVGRGRRRVG
jgi:predicted ATPase